MGAPSSGSCTPKISRTLANGELTMYSAMRLVLSPALGTSTRTARGYCESAFALPHRLRR